MNRPQDNPQARPAKGFATLVYRSFGKRLFDLLVAVLALVVLSPLLAVLALLIRWKLGRDVIFRQMRPGRHGELFSIYKFRTMTDQRDDSGQLLPDDERLTRFGRFLRSTSLDELPELWNVVLGSMSLVGPRPLLPEYLEIYTPEQARRQEVRPGITGWAQVNGRNEVDWDQRFLMDVWYVDHRTMSLDVYILMVTVWKAVSRQGVSAKDHATMPEFTDGSVSQSREVIVIGAGGHARVVIATLQEVGHSVVGVYDDDRRLWGSEIGGVPVIGAIKTASGLKDVAAVVAIGDCARRRQLATTLNLDWLTAVHPRACVHESVETGAGTVVFAGAVIQPNSCIGSHVIVNTGATVDHDCRIGDYSQLGPGVHLAGLVHVGDESSLGTGSSVIPEVRIGSRSTLGAGSVAIRDVADGVVSAGCPARPVSHRGAARTREKQRTFIQTTASDAETIQPQQTAAPGPPPSLAVWPQFDDEMIDAVGDVLRSGRVNYWNGEAGSRFEREFADFVGCRHAIAVANGTVALELALLALGIGVGSEVIVPSRTFIATASSVVVRGATPITADVDRDSQTLTADTVRAVLTSRTKAVIAVHLAGWPCDMDAIMELAASHGLKVIEDCAQAHGATYRGRPVGSIGDVGAFSFCQDKIITTGGEGGLLTTNDADVWKTAWSYKDHGKSMDEVHRRDDQQIFRWLHSDFGTNWRMTEMQAAIGSVALRRLPEWVTARRRNAGILADVLEKLPAIRLTPPSEGFEHAYYKYYAFVRPDRLHAGWDRDRIVRTLQQRGVPCGTGSCSEIYREQAFVSAGLGPKQRLPVARELGETSLMFQVHPTLTAADMEWMARTICKVVTDATHMTPGEQIAA